MNQIEDEMTVDDDEDDDLELAEKIDEEAEEKEKQILQTADQTKRQGRQRGSEILPVKSWRRQSTFRKQSISQMMQLSKQPSNQQLLPPISLSTKDKQFQQSKQSQLQTQSNTNLSLKRGSVVRRPTLRADSKEIAKLCVTNDLEDFIEVNVLV